MTTTASSEPVESRWRRFTAWLRSRAFVFVILFLVLLFVLAYLWPDVVVEVGPGQAGVLWKRFDGGTVTVANDGRPFKGRIDADMLGEATTLIENVDEKSGQLDERGYEPYPYGEGMRFIWPWDEMVLYDIRLQQISHTFEVLANDGLEMKAQIAITWKPIEADLGRLHRDIGPDYIDVLLVPIVGACAREEIARHPPDALYSTQRLAIQEAIRNKVKQTLLSRFYPRANRESYLIVEDVLIREIILPPEVRKAIEEKVAQKHVAESYSYRLIRERQEAERKAIEAEGIRRFQQIINSTISDGYLKWKGIDATLELAKSPNAKMVVIGTGSRDGMPVILGNFENTPGPSTAPATTAIPATGTFGPPAPPP